MLNAAIYIVFAFLLIVCALLLLVVMMQRPKQEGLGAAFGAQMTDQAFGAQTTDVLKKGTVLFGTLFMVLCFVLAVLMNRQFQQSKSDLATKAPVAAQTPTDSAATVQPASEPAQAPALDLEQFTSPVSAETPAPTDGLTPAPESSPVTPTAPAATEEEHPADAQG